MDRAMAHLNVEHFRRLLADETDGARRQTILRLLAVSPFAPMGRMHVDPFPGFRLDPAIENPPAREH